MSSFCCRLHPLHCCRRTASYCVLPWDCLAPFFLFVRQTPSAFVSRLAAALRRVLSFPSTPVSCARLCCGRRLCRSAVASFFAPRCARMQSTFPAEGVPVRTQAPRMLCPLAPGLWGQAARIWHRGYGILCPGHARDWHQARVVVFWRGGCAAAREASWPPTTTSRVRVSMSYPLSFPTSVGCLLFFSACRTRLSAAVAAPLLLLFPSSVFVVTCCVRACGWSAAPAEMLLHCRPNAAKAARLIPQLRSPDIPSAAGCPTCHRHGCVAGGPPWPLFLSCRGSRVTAPARRALLLLLRARGRCCECASSVTASPHL